MYISNFCHTLKLHAVVETKKMKDSLFIKLMVHFMVGAKVVKMLKS